MPDYVELLLLTLVVESALVQVLAPSGLRRRIALDVVFVNLATHPIGFWLAALRPEAWLAIEAAITATEAFVYATVTGLAPRRAIATAILANGTTAALGWGLALL